MPPEDPKEKEKGMEEREGERGGGGQEERRRRRRKRERVAETQKKGALIPGPQTEKNTPFLLRTWETEPQSSCHLIPFPTLAETMYSALC